MRVNLYRHFEEPEDKACSDCAGAIDEEGNCINPRHDEHVAFWEEMIRLSILVKEEQD
jgi:hypothetical protein